MGLALLAQAFLPFSFWWEAFHTAVYLIDRLPSPTLSNTSPFFLLYNKLPDYNFLKLFGCACFPFLRPYNKTKLQYRSSKCVFLGYSNSHKGYKCLHPSGRLYIADTVHFNAHEFPYPSLFPSGNVPAPAATVSLPSLPVLSPSSSSQIITSPHVSDPTTGDLPHSSSSPSLQSTGHNHDHIVTDTSSTSHSPTNNSSSSSFSSSSSSQSSTPPSSTTLNNHHMITRSKLGIFKPKVFTSESVPIAPESTAVALASPSWKEAMRAEFQALIDNQTWELVPYSADKSHR